MVKINSNMDLEKNLDQLKELGTKTKERLLKKHGYKDGDVIENCEGKVFLIEEKFGTLTCRELTEPKKKNTNLEKKMESILEELDIKNYEKQYRVHKYFLDFAFPDIKLAIEPGATVWHDEESDQEKEESLNDQGWKVLWYDQNDLKHNEKEVKEEIAKTIERLRKERKYKFM